MDAVEFDINAGSIVVLDKKQIDTFNVSTHTMPISSIINYIEETIGSKILTIGIQPKQMNLVNKISEDVKNSVDELTDMLVELV